MPIAFEQGQLNPMEQVLANEAALATRLGVAEAPYIPPAERFYHSNYILDGCVAAEVCSSFGYYRKAAKQLNSFRDSQRPDGMVIGVKHPPSRFTINPERLLSTAPFEGNDYTQTPDWARVVLKLHTEASESQPASPGEAINPEAFLEGVYPSLVRYYLYIAEERRVSSTDPRTFLLHPHEANRDSGPEYDQWKEDAMERLLSGRISKYLKRHPRTGEYMSYMFNERNRAVDYTGAIAINIEGRKAGWDPDKIHEKTEFIDVWFNAHLYENYDAMADIAARLGRIEDAAMFAEMATELELAMVKHYDPNARIGKGAFYSEYNGRLQYKDTIGNLASLLLKNSEEDHVRSNITLMDEAFDTPYVLPCIASDDTANFDPHYQERDRHWHNGAVWIVANNVVKRGLNKQAERVVKLPQSLRFACANWSDKIHNSSLEVIAVTGAFAEHYNSITGMGQRMHRTEGHIFATPAYLPR